MTEKFENINLLNNLSSSNSSLTKYTNNTSNILADEKYLKYLLLGIILLLIILIISTIIIVVYILIKNKNNKTTSNSNIIMNRLFIRNPQLRQNNQINNFHLVNNSSNVCEQQIAKELSTKDIKTKSLREEIKNIINDDTNVKKREKNRLAKIVTEKKQNKGIYKLNEEEQKM